MEYQQTENQKAECVEVNQCQSRFLMPLSHPLQEHSLNRRRSEVVDNICTYMYIGNNGTEILTEGCASTTLKT